jgi:hypothetical protein
VLTCGRFGAVCRRQALGNSNLQALAVRVVQTNSTTVHNMTDPVDALA